MAAEPLSRFCMPSYRCLEERKAGGPQPFLIGPAWRDKELQTALGSWTELRHDTILYAKQSYTVISKGMPEIPRMAYGFVEPAPQVYARLAAMFRDLRTTLASLEIAAEGIPQMLTEFETVLTRLEQISIKELAAEPLSDADYAFIANFDGELRSLTFFPPKLMQRITSDTDTRMDVIADVHLGDQHRPSAGGGSRFPGRRICCRARQSRLPPVSRRRLALFCFQFKQPMSDRLTDEQWQKMGRDKKRPQRPDWARVSSIAIFCLLGCISVLLVSYVPLFVRDSFAFPAGCCQYSCRTRALPTPRERSLPSRGKDHVAEHNEYPGKDEKCCRGRGFHLHGRPFGSSLLCLVPQRGA